jgi:hypothetical protein
LRVGDILFTCDHVMLMPSSSVKWRRRGSDCDNTGGSVSTDAANGQIFHVGETGLGPGAKTAVIELPGGFFDLLIADGAFTSAVTIEEGPACEGINHCGLNSALAQAVATEPTPEGTVAIFSGCLAYGDDNRLRVTFFADPRNVIPISTSPLVGPDQGWVFPLQPGQNITFDDAGAYQYGQGPVECVGSEPPTAVLTRSWGRVRSLYR